MTPFIVSIYASEYLSTTYNTKSYIDRLETIGLTREASSGRLNYWESAFDFFVENPIIGSGLGNFKIQSIANGQEYIKGYTVPYHAHNDFIHNTTELGVIGLITYSGLFICLLFYLFKLFRKYKNKSENQLWTIILSMAFNRLFN